jgi:hypothetical protein
MRNASRWPFFTLGATFIACGQYAIYHSEVVDAVLKRARLSDRLLVLFPTLFPPGVAVALGTVLFGALLVAYALGLPAQERPVDTGVPSPAGGMVLQPRFVIPAYDGNAEVKGTTTLNRETVVTTLTPHMHVRGKDMIYIAHYPDGTDETLLSVPKYDFNWQITYELAKPKILPAGTKVEVIAHFDNSTSNKFNPDPSKDVKWGDQTWEEMMIGFWSTVVEAPAKTTQQQ